MKIGTLYKLYEPFPPMVFDVLSKANISNWDNAFNFKVYMVKNLELKTRRVIRPIITIIESEISE